VRTEVFLRDSARSRAEKYYQRARVRTTFENPRGNGPAVTSLRKAPGDAMLGDDILEQELPRGETSAARRCTPSERSPSSSARILIGKESPPKPAACCLIERGEEAAKS